MNPDLVQRLFPTRIMYEPFVVSSTFQQSAHDHSALIPASKLFKLPDPQDLKFFLFKFHSIFDGLLGLDNLKLLQANVNLDTNHIITPYAKIPLQFYKTNSDLNLITVQPRTEQVIKVKTSIKNGEVIIPHTKIQKCEIPESLSLAKNGCAITTILNNGNSPITIDFSDPIEVENFDISYFENIDFNNFNDCPSHDSNFDISKIRVDHLNSEEKSKILKLCQEFSDIFYNENVPLSFTNKIKHTIKTSDETPVYTKSYRYPFIHRQEVDRQIKKMLEQNIIRPSDSPWSSPIWVVPKKLDASGKQKWRVVIDYRKLNEKTIDKKYPLPQITDILDKLGKCQYFSTIDLASGFHQIEMHEDDIPKTAFNAENGHFEFLRMPFGLKNAPATFQQVMDSILRGIQNEKCLVYLDDIIVYSTSLQEHMENLKLVFQRLRDSNFKIQTDKSEFLRHEVAYLGHVVTPSGVKPNPDKILAIKRFPIPKTTKQLKGFLGLLGYYRRFINNFSKLTKPLTKCLKKGAKIEHNDEFVNCFETCKNLLINEPILQYPDFSKPFNLTTDASNVALGAVLSQGPIGQDLPIAYASRTLNDSELNYSTIEKECLCLVWATKYFRPYLFGRKFNIITDHKPLQWLFSLKDPSSKLLRWRIKLEEFDYHIIYKKGKLNTNADALSRIEIHVKETQDTEAFDIDKYVNDVYNDHMAPSTSYDLDRISVIAQPDDEQPCIPDDDNNTVHTNADQDPVVGIPISETAVNYGANQIIIQKVFHSPAKHRITNLFDKKRRITVQFSEDDFEKSVITFIKEAVVPNKLYYLYFEDPDIFEPFAEVIRKTFKWPSLKFLRCLKKLIDVTDKNDIKEIIQNYHESKSNHRGIEETIKRLRERYYWPELKQSVQTYINDCEICIRSKYERTPVKIPMNVTPTASRPFEIIHLDTYTFEKNKFLTIIDSFSKYAQAYHLNSLASVEIVDKLLIFFSHHGIPKQIIVDNGTEFKNSVVTELLTLHKIKVHFCSPHHPESNGVIERLHSTLAEHIRLLNNQNYSAAPMEQKMIYAILAYNHTIHSSTNLKPIDIIQGHVTSNDIFDLKLDQILVNDYVNSHKEKANILYSQINDKLIKKKEYLAEKRNKNTDDPEIFQPDQTVYLKKHTRQKHTDKFTQPTKLISINTKKKTGVTEKQGKVHLSNIKRPLIRKKYSFE